MSPIICIEGKTCENIQKCPQLVQQLPPSISQCCIWIAFPLPRHGTRDWGYSKVLAPPSSFSLFQGNKTLPFKVCHYPLHHNAQAQWGQKKVLLSRSNWVVGKFLGMSYLCNWILHLYFRINIFRIISSFLPVNKKCGVCFCGWLTPNHQGLHRGAVRSNAV